MGALHVFVSASAADRLARARDAVRACSPGARVLIVGATRGAADDLAREVAAAAGATFGIERLSLTQLAARTAIVSLAADGATPSTWLGAEAVAARAAFDAAGSGTLGYLAPVADTPGFPRALARTLQELRLAGLRAEHLGRLHSTGPALAGLLERFESCFAAASTADRAQLFRTAARLLRSEAKGTAGPSLLVLLDVSLDHGAEHELAEAAIDAAPRALATVPHGDRDTVTRFAAIGAEVEEVRASGSDDLACLRQYLFSDAQPPVRGLDRSLEFFSAPGEGREAVEIARRVLREARRGVRFDQIAILVRSPQNYFGLLEHALRRADVPAWFDRGTRRPHPAGRAFLVLLACAAEDLSAARFAEYLSLGQVPQITDGDRDGWVASQDEAFGRAAAPQHDELEVETAAAITESSGDDDAVVAGTLRAPWRWERLLVEAAVIGQDVARWKRRIDGKAAELHRQLDEATRQDGDDSARTRGLQQTMRQLEHLRAFALPVVEELAGWPARATWGEWLDRFEALAPRVLRMPTYVLRVLGDLRPMAGIGPIDLDEARRVLSERLLTLESEPPSRRFGRVFVGTPQQVRGRSFRVVFVPGLAERMFPQKPREDPLLLDELRRELDAGLPQQRERLASERRLLQLAAGAASDRLYVSYPRIELSEARARVPSFYALDIVRAATGHVPDHESLEETARQAANAMLAWPAPPGPGEAIDDQEHDLAVLRRLLDEPDRASVKGHAHYLLKLNDCLRRSVVDRWARGEARWSANDGLVRVAAQTKDALARQRLTKRPYSLSVLQKFSACPYQFLLSAVYRLQALEQPEPLQRMDPLTRGSLFHEIQARFLRALASSGALPVTTASVEAARQALDTVAEEVAHRASDELAPAVERVWTDEIAAIRRDLRGWLDTLAQHGDEWMPLYFEYAFGPKVPGDRDPHSRVEDVIVEGFRLRGAIDLIEEHRQTKLLRVTDHKTGRKPDRIEKVIVGGGAVLQPVLYAMVAERALGRGVRSGRLFYCTSAGSFCEHEIPLNDTTRATGVEVLQVIDRAVENGFLAAAPTEGACDWCEYRVVCGPDVFRRVRRKPQDRLADLFALRSRP